jgi:hypothetical protein
MEKRTKKKPSANKRRCKQPMFAYPTPEEAVILKRGMARTGESESRFLIESGLLRARVVEDRAQRELSQAHALISTQA